MSGKILIIDDDSDFKEAMSTLLEAKGYKVVTAENGKEGIEKIKNEKPNLVMLDVMMTHKSEGFDVARAVDSDPSIKGTPIIITSGIRKEMNLSFGFEPDETYLPVKAVLEKPVKPDALLNEVKKHIRK
ncbi:MAG: response regulator [Candidatus Omnitrophica bacterium]|nr:response regulator [Candidatus Omnitrophota bacterium]